MSETAIKSQETETVKPYKLRKPEASDIFTMMSIINAIGIEDFRTCFQSDNVRAAIAGGSAESVGTIVGMDIAMVLLQNLSRCEQSIYTFLSRISGMDTKEIETLELSTFAEMIIDVFKSDGFTDFIRVVSKLFK